MKPHYRITIVPNLSSYEDQVSFIEKFLRGWAFENWGRDLVNGVLGPDLEIRYGIHHMCLGVKEK